ncbi:MULTISPECIES: site-specific integrase [Burkholderia]|nr:MULTISPECIES: site-specific integrase [Burkholderia]
MSRRWANAVPPDLQTMDGLPDLPDEIRCAPYTEFDVAVHDGQYRVAPIAVRYLYRNVYGCSWYPHLALAVLLLAAQRHDQATVYSLVAVLHGGLRRLFGSPILASRLPSMDALGQVIDEALHLYLAGELGQSTDATRLMFYQRYQSACSVEQGWLQNLPPDQQQVYRPWLLPPANRALHAPVIDMAAHEREREQRRKEETDALMPAYPELRSEAHLRWNWFSKFRQAYRQAVAQCANNIGPVEYDYTDGDRLWHLRIWTVEALRKGPLASFCGQHQPPDGQHLLEVVDVIALPERRQVDPSVALWFADIIRHTAAPDSNPDAKAWRESWGYVTTTFRTNHADLLMSSYHVFIHAAQQTLGHPLLSVDAAYYGMTFGLMAVDVFTTTGARLNEVMQISLSPDCLVRLKLPSIQTSPTTSSMPRIRYVLRMIPKGERKDQRHDYFIGTETKRLLARTALMLAEHYCLKQSEPLPTVPFNQLHRRAHRFKPAPYLFQLGGRHLSGEAITSCVRFLLHGMALRTTSGRIITLRAHLLRHGFATHAVQVEKIPVDIVGAWLHQKSVPVTEYYSQATETMIADAADLYLLRIARSIDVEQAVARSPHTLQQLYDEAVSKTGTLANVVGGHCTSHGLCKVQFACVGCAAKVPDPAQRAQVEHRRTWAERELVYNREQGLLPEVSRLQHLIEAANSELREMDLIDQYRAAEPPLEEMHDAPSSPVVEEAPPTPSRPNGRTRKKRPSNTST